MRNMRIGTRILLGFGVMVALSLGIGVYALSRQAATREFIDQMDNRDFRVIETFRRISQGEDQMRATRGMVLTEYLLRAQHLPAGDLAPLEREWEAGRDRNLALLASLESDTTGYESTALTPARAAQWRKVRSAAREAQDALRALVPEVEAQFAALNAGQIGAMLSHVANVDRLRLDYENKLAEAQHATEEQIATGRAEISQFYGDARMKVWFVIAVAVAIGLLLGYLIERSITRPLSAFMHFVERVGKGDLTAQASDTGKDELGRLASGLNAMAAGLKEVARQTRGVAENLNAATAEILASTQQQAASTAEQAAAVQQASATMAQIAQSGSQISERASAVASAAEATSSASSSGLQSVRDTNATMESIREQAEIVAENVIALSEKTQAIGEIIATVNDLSEESHLLSLNAAIQAASAGEYGRGFSVVAGEMKNLADQSKQATVQVRSILGDIQKAINTSVMLTEEAVKRVESGRRQSQVADRTIRELTGNIEESVQAFQQIVAGSSQQQIGFEQVSQAFRNIGVAAQQTASSTRQSEKAAANLNALAQQLRSAVEIYRI